MMEYSKLCCIFETLIKVVEVKITDYQILWSFATRDLVQLVEFFCLVKESGCSVLINLFKLLMSFYQFSLLFKEKFNFYMLKDAHNTKKNNIQNKKEEMSYLVIKNLTSKILFTPFLYLKRKCRIVKNLL